jgi:pyridoxal 5'-phosphate synthase pdxS subunit
VLQQAAVLLERPDLEARHGLAQTVFVGSGIFKSDDPEARARAVVEATTHFNDPLRVAEASTGLGPAMQSLESRKLGGEELFAGRGW